MRQKELTMVYTKGFSFKL